MAPAGRTASFAAALGGAGLLALSWAACGGGSSGGSAGSCSIDADCTSPGPCEVGEGALCLEHACRYPAKVCDTPPPSACAPDDAIFSTYSTPGTCQADGTCHYTVSEIACTGCYANCLTPCQHLDCSDTHHGCRSGRCVPAPGSNPPANCQWDDEPDGTGCDDGSLCTSGETCQAGQCVAAVTKTCTASDQCHVAGTCNPATGACSDPAKANGTSCSTGNLCQTGQCKSGSCSAVSTKTCTASDQCHVAGTCNSTTGLCSNPAKASGTSCSTGNKCDVATCQSGSCKVTGSVTCTSPGMCENVPGTCDSSTGTCSYPTNQGASCTNNCSFQGGCICCSAFPGECVPIPACPN